MPLLTRSIPVPSRVPAKVDVPVSESVAPAEMVNAVPAACLKAPE